MDLASELSKLLGGIDQFIFELISVALSVLAFIKNRSDIFQSEIAKIQFLNGVDTEETQRDIFRHPLCC